MPSSFSALVRASRFFGLLVALSVPSTPTAVVTPAVVKSVRESPGTRLRKPHSPPPPVKWTC